jgi:hypothetical protein
MRLSFVGSLMVSLILASLPLSPAAARNATASYAACICHFGYGGNDCAPATSCTSEGGQCIRSCPAVQKE